MKLIKTANIVGGQDGAVFGDYLFRFSAKGEGVAYKVVKSHSSLFFEKLCDFKLDKSEIITPHSNSVAFGTQYFDNEDSFPLLYTNLYNAYPKEPNSCGVCCVYRLRIEDGKVLTDLVQILKVGFTDDNTAWRSGAENGDVRPYGNFAIDKDNGKIYAFTMRDSVKKNAYFSFLIPRFDTGKASDTIGVKVYTFEKEDIIDFFEENYTNYMQGAIINKGILYSLEGFTDSKTSVPAIRRIDLTQGVEIDYVNLLEMGYPIEPEFIDFYKDDCIYGDAEGNIYKIEF